MFQKNCGGNHQGYKQGLEHIEILKAHLVPREKGLQGTRRIRRSSWRLGSSPAGKVTITGWRAVMVEVRSSANGWPGPGAVGIWRKREKQTQRF